MSRRLARLVPDRNRRYARLDPPRRDLGRLGPGDLSAVTNCDDRSRPPFVTLCRRTLEFRRSASVLGRPDSDDDFDTLDGHAVRRERPRSQADLIPGDILEVAIAITVE